MRGMRRLSVANHAEEHESPPRIFTRLPGAADSNMQGRLLRSASVAVADVLGVDPSELPQPFGGLNRTQSITSSVYSQSDSYSTNLNSVDPSPIDYAWDPQSSFLIQKGLVTAMADLLGLKPDEISREDSFVDIGGDWEKAEELCANCKATGLSVQPHDVLACRSIAELETMITPLNTSQTTARAPSIIVSPLSIDIGVRRPLHIATQMERPPSVPPRAPRRKSRLAQQKSPKSEDGAQIQYRDSSSYLAEVESILSLNEAVSQAVVIRPKAGPFEGQAVALLTLTSCSMRQSADCEVTLEAVYETNQLSSARRAVKETVSSDHTPKIWVVLQQVPLFESGNINRRKLQTWIQNVNEELYTQIMSANSKEDLAQSLYKNERQGTTLTDAIMQDPYLEELASVAQSEEVSWLPRYESNELLDVSPMQRLYFHTSMGNGNTQHHSCTDEYRFNQSVLLRLKGNVDAEEVHAAVEAVVGHHSMLRCRFCPDGNSWSQWIDTDIPSSYQFSNHVVSTDDEVGEIISIAQSTINIEQGPVFAARHFHTYDGYQMLYLVAHRLVVDLKSWPVITNDLDELLTNGCLTSGRSLPFPSWIAQQRYHAQALEAPSFVACQISPPVPDFWGIYGANTYGSTKAAGFTLDTELVSLLGNNGGVFRSDYSDIFIAALLLSFSRAFRDRPVPTLWNQENERVALDTGTRVSETVGWFTSLCPVVLDISHSDDILTVLSLTKDKRHSFAAKGVPSFTASLMDAESAISFVSSYCPMEVIFNFAGDMQNIEGQNGLFEEISVPENPLSLKTSNTGPSVGRISAFEISAVIDQGEAKFEFLYPQQSRHQEQIQAWISGYKALLLEVLGRLKLPSPDLVPSDIHFLETTCEELAQLNQKILPALDVDPTNVAAIYPVTETQQSILINESLTSGSGNIQVIYEFDPGNTYVDIGRICAAWQQISDRHSALRTIFVQSVSKAGLYDQLVLHHHSPNMLFIESKYGAQALNTIENVPSLPWVEGTPWHRLIVCQGRGKILLRLESSRATCDHTSLTILFKELEQAYSKNQLPEPRQFSHQSYLDQSKTAPGSIDYWKEQLDGCQPCLFPVLAANGANDLQWNNITVDLPISREQLAAFAAEHNVNTLTVLQVAWALVLRTYVGTDDVCFGHHTSNRDIPVSGLSEAVGCFSTTLICRVFLPTSRSIIPILQEADERYQEALHHKYVAISHIQHALGIKGHCVFNTCMSFGSMDMANELSSSSSFCHVKSQFSSEYDINVDVNFLAGNISLDIGQRILSRGQVEIVAHAFGRAVQTIIGSPESLVKEADLFSERDHKQILAWNSMSQPGLIDQPIHELIEAQASMNPDMQAICAWDGNFTYSELHERSMALAGHLMTSGLQPQTPVPVIVDKSRWAVVAMLAVLHANAILVPVDAEATLLFSWVIEAVGARSVLASDSVRRDLDSVDIDLVIVNEYTVSAMSAQAAVANSIKTKPADLACILFEHESPESQKGIVYSHRTLATACVGQGPALRIFNSSRVMQISSYSVDVALSELFTTLTNGGCVCIPSASERLADFAGAARRMNVNWTYMTPTLSRILKPESLHGFAVVCFRTRHLDADTYRSWAERAKILLAYGPPDTFPLGLSVAEVTDTNATQFIGSPICGNFWVVSPEDSNRLMPVGAVGELIIGSPGLATEIDLKEMSVEEWTVTIAANSLKSENSGMQLLETGQFVRYREDGQIEFAESDYEADQIGWSAVRQSETESALRRCLGRGVDVAVEMVSSGDVESLPTLTAFVELGDNLFYVEDLSKLGRVTKTKERLYLMKQMADMTLGEMLPSHMIPSAYIPVKKLPLTPSLEVNRKDLHKLVARLSQRQLLNLAEAAIPLKDHALGFKPPSFTEIEKLLRRMWASVLDIPEISIGGGDRFLDLGGDAVLAHRLVVACRENSIIVSVVDVLRNLSLSELSKGAVVTRPVTRSNELIRQIDPSSTSLKDTSALQLTDGDRRQFEDVAEASSLQILSVQAGLLRSRGNINYITFEISGSIDWRKLESACARLVETHSILRTGFVTRGCQLFQTVFRSRSYHPDFQRHQCPSWRLSSVTTKVIKKDQSTPVDFREPVTKFILIDAGKTSTLLLRLSRAQYNEASLQLLLRDLSQLYDSPDNALNLYSSFCDVVRATKNSNTKSAADYWRTLMERSTMTNVIPQPSPAIPALGSKTIRQQIPVGAVQSIDVSFEIILKGAWSIVLSSLSGSDDIVFGQLVEGRSLRLVGGSTVADVAGPSGNIIPVRTRLPGISISAPEYLRCIQSQHDASIPHENIQFMDIVRDCTSWPAWTRFSTVVQHTDQHKPDTVKRFPLGKATCKVSCQESNRQNSDIFVQSMALGDADVDVSITFCEKEIPPPFAVGVLEMLCSTITLLVSTPATELLPFKFLNGSSTLQIPLPSAPRQDVHLMIPVQPVHPNNTKAINNMIKDAWVSHLDLNVLSLPNSHNIPFYEICGSLIVAADLARHFTEHIPSLQLPGLQRVEFAMEDIIEHPTMANQYDLIISRRKTPRSRRKSSSPSRGTHSRGIQIRRINPDTVQSPPPGRLPSASCTPARHHAVSSNSSMESMTTGSSHSDKDELGDEVNPKGSVSGGKKTPRQFLGVERARSPSPFKW